MIWKPHRLAASVVVGVLCAACGSTAQARTQLGMSAQQDGLAGVPGGLTSDVPGPGAGGLTSGAQGTSGGSAAGGSGLTGPAGGASGTAGGTAVGAGAGSPRVTSGVARSGPIRIGYLYSSDQQAAAQQFGLKGVVAGDTQAQYQAIAKDLNSRGGVLGRQLLLIGHDISTANEATNPSAEENAACEDFVRDKKVFAVVGGGVFLSPCLAKAGIASINGGSFDDPATIDGQLIFDGGGMLSSVLAKAYVDRLAAQRYFTGWNTATGQPGSAPVKVGLIYQDLPIFRHYYASVKAELRTHGITVDPTDEFIYTPTVDGVTSQSQAAVIKFSSDGVTHVFGAALFF
jgi:hypothetical protein